MVSVIEWTNDPKSLDPVSRRMTEMATWIRMMSLLSVIVMICVPGGAQELLHWELEVPYPDSDRGSYADVVVEPDTGRIAGCARANGDTFTEISYMRYFGRDGWTDGWRGFLWGGIPGTDFGEDISMAVTLAPAGLRTGIAYHNSTDLSLEYNPLWKTELYTNQSNIGRTSRKPRCWIC